MNRSLFFCIFASSALMVCSGLSKEPTWIKVPHSSPYMTYPIIIDNRLYVLILPSGNPHKVSNFVDNFVDAFALSKKDSVTRNKNVSINTYLKEDVAQKFKDSRTKSTLSSSAVVIDQHDPKDGLEVGMEKIAYRMILTSDNLTVKNLKLMSRNLCNGFKQIQNM